jgi:hypothetical protein
MDYNRSDYAKRQSNASDLRFLQMIKQTALHFVNSLVIAVVNFRLRQIADFMSEVLIFGVTTSQDLPLSQFSQNVRSPLGAESTRKASPKLPRVAM